MPADRPLNLPAAVIFDMDGLLLDSEAVMRRCFDRIAAKQGWTLAPGVFESMIGLNRAMSLDVLARHVPAEIGAVDFDAAVHAAYDAEIARGIPLKFGALSLVEHLVAHEVPCAVATSSAVQLAERKLSAAGLLKRLDAVASGEEVANGKPAPDVFLLAAERLRVPPSECVAFEDSPTGVRSALAAGMRVVQVPDMAAAESGMERHGVIVAETLIAGAIAIGLLHG